MLFNKSGGVSLSKNKTHANVTLSAATLFIQMTNLRLVHHSDFAVWIYPFHEADPLTDPWNCVCVAMDPQCRSDLVRR